MTKKDWPPRLYRSPQSKAHPYPLEIALHATIFTVGAIFYYAFVDAAVGEYVKDQNSYHHIRTLFLGRGLTDQAWEENWRAFEAYLKAFPNPVFQNALFGMVMHWDWYIAKIGKFVEFARTHYGDPTLSKKQQSVLNHIAFKSIGDQITILSDSTSLAFDLDSDLISELTEMDLVRNLGMHNQWAVSGYYRQHTASRYKEIGAIRVVDVHELEAWQRAINSVIGATSVSIANKYVNVPDFCG